MYEMTSDAFGHMTFVVLVKRPTVTIWLSLGVKTTWLVLEKKKFFGFMVCAKLCTLHNIHY